MYGRRGDNICQCHLMKWPRAYFITLVSCPSAHALLDPAVCAPYLLSVARDASGKVGGVKHGPEWAWVSRWLPDRPIGRFPCPCSTYSPSLISVLPVLSTPSSTKVTSRFPNEMESAIGIWNKKQRDGRKFFASGRNGFNSEFAPHGPGHFFLSCMYRDIQFCLQLLKM